MPFVGGKHVITNPDLHLFQAFIRHRKIQGNIVITRLLLHPGFMIFQQLPAGKRLRNILRAGQVRDFTFGNGLPVKRHIHAKGMEGVFTGGCHLKGTYLIHEVRCHAPQKNTDVRYIVFTPALLNTPDVDGTCQLVKGRIYIFQLLPVLKAGGSQVVRAEVVQVLGGNEQFEIFHHIGIPPGDVPGQLLNNGCGPLSSPVGNGVGDFGAPAEFRVGNLDKRTVAHKCADIRHHPFAAGLDELVVVELVEVLLEIVKFACKYGNECF